MKNGPGECRMNREEEAGRKLGMEQMKEIQGQLDDGGSITGGIGE